MSTKESLVYDVSSCISFVLKEQDWARFYLCSSINAANRGILQQLVCECNIEDTQPAQLAFGETDMEMLREIGNSIVHF